MESVGAKGRIDTGAEEELFRRMGQRASAEVLARRWEEADSFEERWCPDCGAGLQILGLRQKKLQTLCGPIEVRRRVWYCQSCRATYAPLDRRLGTDETGITPGLMRVICRVALELAYKQSSDLLADTLGFVPCSARQVERIAKRHGARMDQHVDEGEPCRSRQQRRRQPPAYCLAIDGTMIPGLADVQEHRLVWHEVKVATLLDPRGIKPPLYVAASENTERFQERLWKELQARGIAAHDVRLVLGDGAVWIWNLVESCFPSASQLLDFYHAAEHLHATAEALWAEPTRHTWWHRRLNQLKDGQLSNFFAALKLIARRHETTDPELSPKRLLKYFSDNCERLNYCWALEHRLPIGSGAVESAARHIVQQRLKQSGMRWSIPGAQAVLNLRTHHRNGEFEQYWENHAAAG